MSLDLPEDVPCEVDLGRAMNALHDAIADARSDAARARAAGDELGAQTHVERAEGLQRVHDWLERVELQA